MVVQTLQTLTLCRVLELCQHDENTLSTILPDCQMLDTLKKHALSVDRYVEENDFLSDSGIICDNFTDEIKKTDNGYVLSQELQEYYEDEKSRITHIKVEVTCPIPFCCKTLQVPDIKYNERRYFTWRCQDHHIKGGRWVRFKTELNQCV